MFYHTLNTQKPHGVRMKKKKPRLLKIHKDLFATISLFSKPVKLSYLEKETTYNYFDLTISLTELVTLGKIKRTVIEGDYCYEVIPSASMPY